MCALRVQKAKPINLITSFASKYIAVPIYGTTKKNERVLKHSAPRIVGKLRSKSDTSFIKIRKQLTDLQKELKELSPDAVDKRQEIEKKITTLSTKQAKLFDNVIEIDKFNFIKEIESAEGNFDKIIDPELKGLISIFNSKMSKEEKETTFKTLVDRFGFKQTNAKFQEYPKIFKEVVSDDKKYQVKMFNNNFEHPYLIDENGNKIPKKIGKEGEFMKSYLKRSYEYFDKILEQVVKGTKIEKIFDAILKSEEKKKKINKKTILDVFSKLEEAKGDKEEMKKIMKSFNLSKDETITLNIIKSTDSLINELKTYEKLSSDFEKYQNDNKIYKSAVDDLKSIKADSMEEFLISITKILTKLHQIKLDELVLDEFIKKSEIKLPKTFKKRLLKCIEEEKEIEIVEDTKLEKDDDRFLKSEFEKLGEKDDLYDISKFDKFGKILDIEAAKSVRIAVGLRIVSELKKIINEKQLEGINTFVLMC